MRALGTNNISPPSLIVCATSPISRFLPEFPLGAFYHIHEHSEHVILAKHNYFLVVPTSVETDGFSGSFAYRYLAQGVVIISYDIKFIKY